MNMISKTTAQQIVDAVKDVCGFPINFMDHRGVIIASTDSERIGIFHEAGEHAIKTGVPLEVYEDGSFHGTKRGINIPVAYNGTIIAAVGISGAPDETRVFVRLAEQITRLIIREQELNTAARTKNERKNYLISALRNGNIENPSHVSRLLDEFQLGDEELKRILIFRLRKEKSISISAIEAEIQHLFIQIPNALVCYQYPEEFIAVLNASSFDEHQDLIKSFIEKKNGLVVLGIGQAENTYHLNASFHTAGIALNSLQNAESYALFDNLSLEILLGSIPEKYKKEFVLKTLCLLSADDIALLHTYYEEGYSLESTCKKLYMHKNTLQYKLDRIHRICGFNPRDFKDAVILYLAAKMYYMILPFADKSTQ